jgi:hypothetical protein
MKPIDMKPGMSLLKNHRDAEFTEYLGETNREILHILCVSGVNFEDYFVASPASLAQNVHRNDTVLLHGCTSSGVEVGSTFGVSVGTSTGVSVEVGAGVSLGTITGVGVYV